MTIERVRAKVHEAAGRIEIPAFDPQAVAAASRAPQRRPWVPLAAAAALVGAVISGAAWLTLSDAGDSGDSGEPQRAASTEQTTPGALVAIALDHIAAEPSYFEADHRPQDLIVSAALRFGSNGEYDGDQLSLHVESGDGPEWGACNDYDDGCATIETGTGDVTLSWQEVEPEEDPGVVYVSQARDDGYSMVGYAGQSIVGDPREQALPVSVEEMVAIVSDPAYGPRTTAEYVAAGAELDWDHRAEEPDANPGDGLPLSATPAALAAAVEAHLESEGFADRITGGVQDTFVEPDGPMRDGWGLLVTLEGGYALHVTVIAAEGPVFLECQKGMTCWDFEGVVLTGRPGLAGAFRSDSGATVHAWLKGPGIDPEGPESFGMGEVGRPGELVQLLAATVRLVNADGVSQFTSQRWLDEGPSVEWLHS